MNRQAQAAVLFLLGASLLHAGSTDLYLRYVKAGLQPLLLASGAILVAAALATAWYERGRARHMKREDEDPQHDEYEGTRTPEPEDQQPHTHREPRVAWLLVLPLFALILVAPPALGSYTAARTGTALQKPLAYPALPSTDPLRLSVVDYAGRAVYDHGHTLEGRRIELTGFLSLDHDGTPYLVRMALNCCAADAQPVKIALTGNIPPVLQPDTWLRITGHYTSRRTKDPVNNAPIPYIQITTAKPVPTPSDPYDESWNN